MKYILDDHESHSTQHGINQEKELLGKDSLNFNENQWKLSQTYHTVFEWRQGHCRANPRIKRER